MKKDRSQHGFTIVELMFSTMAFSTILVLCLASLVQIGRMYYKGITNARTQEAARLIVDELTQAIQLSSGNIKQPTLVGPGTLPTGPVVPVVSGDVAAGTTAYFCIGTTRYTYALDRKHSPNKTNNAATKEIYHAFWVDEPPVCADAASASAIVPSVVNLKAEKPTADATGKATGRDLLGDNMRLTRLRIVQPAGSTNNSVWQVQVTVVYGDEDLLQVNNNGTPTDTSDDRRTCTGSRYGTQFCAYSELSTIVKRRIKGE